MRVSLAIIVLAIIGSSFILIPHKSLNLTAIDGHVLEIKRQAGYSKQIHKEIWDQSTQGGDMIAYLDKNNAPMLITATSYGETGKSTDSLYYWDKQLWFVKSVNSRYDKSIYAEDGPVNVIHVEAYTAYFRPNNMDYLFINGKAVTDSVQKRDFQENMFKTSSMYLDSCKL